MISKTSATAVYVATGERYFKEAISSALTLRRHCSCLRILVYTDANRFHRIFDEIRMLPKPSYSFADKIEGLIKFDGKKGVFLDTDTRIFADISPLLKLTDHFDISAAHASWRYSLAICQKTARKKNPLYHVDSCPRPFCEFNTGVIVFRNNAKWKVLLKDWRAEYRRQSIPQDCRPSNDQPAFRLAIWKSDLRIYVLPPEYNFRCDFPGYIGSELVIAHGRHKRIREIAGLVNKRKGARIFLPKPFRVVAYN